MPTKPLDRELVERALGQAIVNTQRARWGITNQTDIITLEGGARVVLQRYARWSEAAYRLRVMRGLFIHAARAGIVIPRVRAFDSDATPPWVIFDALPGVPVPDAGEAGPEGAKFSAIARAMGELLVKLRELPTSELDLNGTWAEPEVLAAEAERWIARLDGLTGREQGALRGLVRRVPELFAERTAAFAHGDFAPVNVLTDGEKLTGLVDFESARLADPLYDVAWWAWAVSFGRGELPAASWAAFLEGAGIDPGEPLLRERVRALQVLRVLELLTGEPALTPSIHALVIDRLREVVARDA